MFIKIGADVVNLAQVKSVCRMDNDKSMLFSCLEDYDYEVSITLESALALFQKAGIETVKVNNTEFVVKHNVLSISPEGRELLVIYKDGSDETFDKVLPLSSLMTISDSFKEVDEGEIELDEVDDSEIPSDLQEMKPESRSAISIQILIAVAAVLVIAYQLYSAKH